MILLTADGSAAFYTATVTVPFPIRETFFRADGTSGELAATGLVLAPLVALMLMQPRGGALSDRIGRKPMLITFGALGFVGAGVLVTVAARRCSTTRDDLTSFVGHRVRSKADRRLGRTWSGVSSGRGV